MKKGGYTANTFRAAPEGTVLRALFEKEARRNGGDGVREKWNTKREKKIVQNAIIFP